MSADDRPISAEAQDDPVAIAAARLQDAEGCRDVTEEAGDLAAIADAELRVAKAQLGVAQAELKKAKQSGDRDQVAVAEAKVAFAKKEVAVAKQEIAVAAAKAQLGVAEAELKKATQSGDQVAVAEAKVAVVKQEVAVAEAKVAVAEAKVAVAGPDEKETARAVLNGAIRGLSLAQDAYQRALHAGSGDTSTGSGEARAGQKRKASSVSSSSSSADNFRNKLLRRPDEECCVTKADPSVCDGAHIVPRKRRKISCAASRVQDIMDVRNGVLLRKDVHWLFDQHEVCFTAEEGEDGIFIYRFCCLSEASSYLKEFEKVVEWEGDRANWPCPHLLNAHARVVHLEMGRPQPYFLEKFDPGGGAAAMEPWSGASAGRSSAGPDEGSGPSAPAAGMGGEKGTRRRLRGDCASGSTFANDEPSAHQAAMHSLLSEEEFASHVDKLQFFNERKQTWWDSSGLQAPNSYWGRLRHR